MYHRVSLHEQAQDSLMDLVLNFQRRESKLARNIYKEYSNLVRRTGDLIKAKAILDVNITHSNFKGYFTTLKTQSFQIKKTRSLSYRPFISQRIDNNKGSQTITPRNTNNTTTSFINTKKIQSLIHP